MVFLVLLGLAIALQCGNGAYRSDFGGHADEPAHVVTGLMLRDYLAGPLWSGVHPMRYAEDYYQRFPKVALGHYPPGFYLVEGLWLLPSRSKVAVLLLPAFLSALLAWLVFRVGREWMPFTTSVAAAVVFLCLRLVQTYTAIVMADMLLSIGCLLAVLAFARFMDTGKIRWSLAFGVLAAAATLTKASGLLLALVPPVMIVMTGKWRLVKNFRLWLAPLPVVALALPWIVFTAHITEEGMSGVAIKDYVVDAIPYYLVNGAMVLGVVGCGMFIAAIVVAVMRAVRGVAMQSRESSLWALIVAVVVFYCVAPAGLDERYLLPAVAPALVLGFLGVVRLMQQCERCKNSALATSGIAVVLAVAMVVEMHRTPDKLFVGAAETIAQIVAESDGETTVLICSDAKGEGAVIAAAALQAPERLTVQRGTKLLSTSDWMGRDYEVNFSNAAELEGLLGENGVEFICIDESVDADRRWAHQDAVEKIVQSQDKSFPVFAEVAMARREVHATMAVHRVAK